MGLFLSTSIGTNHIFFFTGDRTTLQIQSMMLTNTQVESPCLKAHLTDDFSSVDDRKIEGFHLFVQGSEWAHISS